jgi:hypothetical protein
MVIAEATFRVGDVPHRIELETLPAATEYVVRVDGDTHTVIPVRGLGFRRRFALFNGVCTVSLLRLGGQYRRCTIKMQQPSRTVTA